MKKTFMDRELSIKVKEMRRAVSRQFRTLAHGGFFGLLCVVSVICIARPLWPSAPRWEIGYPAMADGHKGRALQEDRNVHEEHNPR